MQAAGDVCCHRRRGCGWADTIVMAHRTSSCQRPVVEQTAPLPAKPELAANSSSVNRRFDGLLITRNADNEMMIGVGGARQRRR